MQALVFYLTYPLIYLIALLPFSVLYKISDVLYYLLKLSGYRKKVVLNNLRNSFPEKSEKEIESIANTFFRYLCDLILETLKTLTLSEKETLKRSIFHTTDWLENYKKENKNFMIVMGHYGNWEWAGPGYTLSTKIPLAVIYRPLSNPYFEKMMTGMRTKFGTRIIPVNNTLRDMVANRNKFVTTAFVADQTATPEGAYWTNFLNQDTAVFVGPEKLSKKFNYPVVYMHITRPKRGYYEIFPELLIADPQKTADNEISEAFTQRLEKAIIKEPSIWLWSHKRWKHKRPN